MKQSESRFTIRALKSKALKASTLLSVLFLSACGGGGGGGADPVDPPPPQLLAPALTDLTAQTLVVNSALTPVSFVNAGGGQLSACNFEPQTLVAGLAIAVSADATTCELSGTATETQAATAYTVTAVNASGSSDATVTIIVNPEQPALVGIDDLALFQGQSTQTLLQNNGGGDLSDCSADALPAGLTVAVSADANSCEISGIPTEIQAATAHTITAVNASGSSNAVANISVALAAPALSDTDLNFVQGQLIGLLLENSGGGELTDCTPESLPVGLAVAVSADATTCEITGEATDVVGATSFAITASNTSGNSTATVLFQVDAATAYITTWKTDNEGVSNDDQITIKVSPEFSYDYSVDWGDGTVDNNVSTDITHTYAAPGTYTVSITGAYPQSYFQDIVEDLTTGITQGKMVNTQTDSLKLLTVEQWGNRPWLSMRRAFLNAQNLVINDTANPNLSQVSSMEETFKLAENFNSDISGWDVSNVTSFFRTFRDATNFNQDISSWDVSSVTSFEQTFRGATSFNQDISGWDVSSVASFVQTFRDATSFNQDISSWDLSSATDTEGMFQGASEFNQAIGIWNVSGVTRMVRMFSDAIAFNQDISAWDVSNVTRMGSMFRGASAFNQDISTWDVSNVIKMGLMFDNASAFDQNIGSWNIANVDDMSGMLSGNTLSLENYDALLNGWATQSVQQNVDFNAGSQFTVLAQASRDVLTGTFGWDIEDRGLITVPNLEAATLKLFTNNGFDFFIENAGGTPDTCTSDDLPEGLIVQVSLSGTCQIRGAVATLQTATGSTITATNRLGSSDAIITIEVLEEAAYVTTWKTDNAGVSNDDQITLQAAPNFIHDYNVDWGDGTVDANVTGDITHTYAAPGTYTVSITGNYPQPYFASTNSNASDSLKLLTIEQWGGRNWLSMRRAFQNADNLVINDTSIPDFFFVSDMSSMFQSANNFTSDISAWDVSRVKNMSAMFSGAQGFNGNIGGWNVSNVTNISNMFQLMRSFNQNIGSWDVSNVRAMNRVFFRNRGFDQDISTWDVSSVTSMNRMFEETSFRGDLSTWDVSNVRNMDNMFRKSGYNQDISAWNVSSVTSMQGMFSLNGQFNQNISIWDVSNVTSMNGMFERGRAFNQDISVWDVSKVTSMRNMFEGATVFDQNLAPWNVSSVSNMTNMFNGSGLTTLNYDALLTGWSQLTELKNGVNFSAGTTTFSPSSQAAKDILTNTFEWNITDGGPVVPPAL